MKSTSLVERVHFGYRRIIISTSSSVLPKSMASYGGSVGMKLCKDKKLKEAFQVVDLLHQQGIPVSREIIYNLLQACTQRKNLEGCRKVHSLMVKNGLDSITVLWDHLIRLFAACGSLEEANRVFSKVSKASAYTWNAIISAHTKFGHGEEALQLYDTMQRDGLNPSKHTYSCILTACCSLRSLGQGRLIHDQIIRSGVESDMVIGNSLVDTYAKCGSLEDAGKVFDSLLDRNVVSWAAMIGGYAECGQGLAALELLQNVQVTGVQLDTIIYLCSLKACVSLGDVRQCRLVHEQIVQCRFEADLTVGNALIDMYGKCGRLEEAHKLFDKLPNRDVVTWGALISSYTQQGHGLPALELLTKMKQEGVKPDKLVLSSILKACGSIGAIGQGKLMYNSIISGRLESDVVIESTLVDMYAKCGRLQEAREVFDKLQNRDVVLWGIMIAAYVQHEDGHSALEIFEKMQKEGIFPEKATLLSVLKACGSIGALGQARSTHKHIIRTGLEVEVTIGNALVDAYAKCGSLEEAHKVFDKLPIQDVVSWGAIIVGYARNGNWRSAIKCLEDLLKQGLKPDDAIVLNILTACGHAGVLKVGLRYFKSLENDHQIIPNIEHYNCLVDLLGRAGLLKAAEDLLNSIPLGIDIVGWTSLLTGCRAHGNTDVGKQCFDHIMRLYPSYGSGYVLMSNIYADAHMWGDVSKMQVLKKYSGVQKKPGTAWIEVRNKVHEFVVGGKSESQNIEISEKSLRLTRLSKDEGYMPQLNLVLDSLPHETRKIL